LNKLFVITYEPFPIGMAATNRILSWTKVLAQNNIDIKILILKPTEKENNLVNINSFGSINGVAYEYLNGYTIWPIKIFFIYKFFILLYSHFVLLKRIVNEKPKTLVTYSPFIYTKLFLILLKKIMRFILVIEETEYPKVLKKKSSKFNKYIHLSSYKYADKMMVMTKELSNYFHNELKVKEVFHLPMSVDISRFDNIEKINTESDYFIYVGGQGGFIRDGLDDIIKAFIIFGKNQPNYKLLIVGSVDQNSKSYLESNKNIEEARMVDRILFVGAKRSIEIPQLLVNSKGIIMAPPKNYTSGGFPTKLGEFLASKRPVICTAVSEIPDYLNESNSFLVKPGDVDALSKALSSIVIEFKRANEIGNNGYEICEDYFDVNIYGESLQKFLIIKN
jgi:glycosyltransferase involved in cell wall biosynthesis